MLKSSKQIKTWENIHLVEETVASDNRRGPNILIGYIGCHLRSFPCGLFIYGFKLRNQCSEIFLSGIKSKLIKISCKKPWFKWLNLSTLINYEIQFGGIHNIYFYSNTKFCEYNNYFFSKFIFKKRIVIVLKYQF